MSLGTGELHVLKTTGMVDTGGAVTEKLAVTFTAAPKQVDTASVAGGFIFGIAMWTAAAGETVTIIQSGHVICTSGDAVTVGAEVAIDAAGKIVDAVSTDLVVGLALTATAATDEDVLVDLYHAGYVKA